VPGAEGLLPENQIGGPGSQLFAAATGDTNAIEPGIGGVPSDTTALPEVTVSSENETPVTGGQEGGGIIASAPDATTATETGLLNSEARQEAAIENANSREQAGGGATGRRREICG
jgi:hypothetical protein